MPHEVMVTGTETPNSDADSDWDQRQDAESDQNPGSDADSDLDPTQGW